MKKHILSIIISIILALSVVMPVLADEVTTITWGDSNTDSNAEQKKNEKNYLALGADLTSEQLATVLSLMGLSATDIGSYNIVYIDNATEHQYLDNYVSSSVIGTKSLSSVLVQPRESGHGVVVKTININYCTEGMYRNALLTAGVENADITVVGPTPISGTAALIGALKAYEEMSGESVTEQTVDTALNELVTTGELADALGDSDEIEELIAFIKAEIAGKNLETKEDIEKAVRDAVDKYGASLTESEIQQIVDLMVKIKELGLDYNTLLDQASDLYSKYGTDLLNADGSLSGAAKSEIIKQAVGSFFNTVFEKIGDFFKGLFDF